MRPRAAASGHQRALWRHQVGILISLTVLALLAWAVLIAQARSMNSMAIGLTMGMDAGFFLIIWIAMMAAMMFPAAAPMVLAFAQVQVTKQRQGRPATPTWVFVGAYLAVWSAVGIVAYVVAVGAQDLGRAVPWIGENGPRFGGLLLIAAGLYQLTPLKHVCLMQCRSPLAFILTSWRDGVVGALRMGVSHGLYCLGCCWLLFAILFPLGMMNIALLAVVTLLIFAEKSLPFGARLSWPVAALLVGYGIAVLVSPAILPMQPQRGMMT
jgi:predicted metal-binding membrane protein